MTVCHMETHTNTTVFCRRGTVGLTSLNVLSTEALPTPVLISSFEMVARLHAFCWKGGEIWTRYRHKFPELGMAGRKLTGPPYVVLMSYCRAMH
jgi:hypothetical protein